MKTLIRLNLVVTAQNSCRIFEDLESLRFSENDALEVKNLVSKWVRRALSEDSVESLDRKFALFMTDKMYPLSQFRNLVENDVDQIARDTVKSIYLKRQNTVEDVPVFILDEEICDIEYLTIDEIGREESVSSYILPVYILTEKNLESVFRYSLFLIQNSNEIIEFKQSLFIEKLIDAIIQNRFHHGSKMITANMLQTQDETYKEASLAQSTFRRVAPEIDA